MLSIYFALFIGFTEVRAESPDAIHIPIGGEPSTLEPAMPIDQYSLGILRNVVEGLFKLDPDGKLKNGLIESYKISNNELTYTFRLKKASWSDGDAVTVDDFIFAFRRLLDPHQASPNAQLFFSIKNSKDCF